MLPESEVEKKAIEALEAEEEQSEAEADAAKAAASRDTVAAAEAAAALANAEAARATQSAAEFLKAKEGDIECLKQQSTQSGKHLETIAQRQEASETILAQVATQVGKLTELITSTPPRSTETAPEEVNPENEEDLKAKHKKENPPPKPQKKRVFI